MGDTQEKKPLSEVFADAFVSGRKEVKVPYKGETYTFFITPVGFVKATTIAAAFDQNNPAEDRTLGLASLMADAISDGEGRKFTPAEIGRLKKEIAEPLLQAFLETTGLGAAEKN